jgi:non-ribosomal peptide synthetase component F
MMEDQLEEKLTSGQYHGIEKFTKENKSTLFAFLMSALYLFIYRYSRKKTIVVGTAVSGRMQEEFDQEIGLFVNTIAIPLEINIDGTFNDFFTALNKKYIDCMEYQDYPFDLLLEKLDYEIEKNRNPLFDIMLVLQNASKEFEETNEISFSKYELDRKYTLFDLTFNFEFANDGLELELQYNRSLFHESTVNQFLENYSQIIDRVLLSEENQLLKSIIEITEIEKKELLYDFNNTYVKYPDRTIIDLFEEQVETSPESVAIYFGDKHLTYKVLNEKVNQFAHHLINELGVKKGDIIAVQQQRTDLMLISVLAIMKSAAVFLPIDRNYPDERFSFILGDANVKYCFTDSVNEFLNDSRVIEINNFIKKLNSESVKTLRLRLSRRI